jgi:hypothetical protein
MFQQEEQLDGEALIRSIHAATAENSRIHTSFANTLEANISTVFNSGYKFIYELLQNADDAGASCIQFNLTESELIISHNGTPFSAEDVNKLCDNAMIDSDKSRQLDKTGY